MFMPQTGYKNVIWERLSITCFWVCFVEVSSKYNNENRENIFLNQFSHFFANPCIMIFLISDFIQNNHFLVVFQS